jgi:hypothetical protein
MTGANLPTGTAPTLAFVPPLFKGQDYLLAAGGVAGPAGFAYKAAWFHGEVGAAGSNWLSWQDVPNGTFASGPALAAVSHGEFGSEVTLYGRGLDSRMLVSNQVPTGSFSVIGSQTFDGAPYAMGFGEKFYVSATGPNFVPYMNVDKYYSYGTWAFDNGSNWGYQGAGDWAFNEFKGGCAANQWSMGVSAATGSGHAHSLLCASTGGASTFTSNLHTLNISTANDGYGNHNLGFDWDANFIKGECAANEVVVGLSQSTSSGALNHVRCASAGATATNCRARVFSGGDNRESPGNPSDWAPGYYKGECAKNSAIAGVSRSVGTGALHAILCCDLSVL